MISKRVAANRNKVHQNKGVPGLEAEVEKLEESIRAVSVRANLYTEHVAKRVCVDGI